MCRGVRVESPPPPMSRGLARLMGKLAFVRYLSCKQDQERQEKRRKESREGTAGEKYEWKEGLVWETASSPVSWKSQVLINVRNKNRLEMGNQELESHDKGFRM